MVPTPFVLHQPLTARSPGRWNVQLRYAIRLPDEAVELPAGTWLLALDDDPPYYRLADGRVVVLEAPLTAEQAAPLTDPQAIAALTAYRPLEQAVREDWGLHVEHIDHNPPFRLIQCPLCSGTDFVTVAFVEAWCHNCNAQFNVRHTAGDPGFVVDVKCRYAWPGAARYLLPRTDELLLTMVFKDSGDPLDLVHSPHCHRSECTPDQIALTDGQDGPLRAGLHACALGDIYDWSFYGGVPTVYHSDRHGHHDLLWPDGRQELWPCTAFLPVTGFSWEDKQQLESVAAMLRNDVPGGRYRDGLLTFLQHLLDRPRRAPHVGHRSTWPHRKHLKEGEKYLLYRWLLKEEKEDGWVTAAPVWLVVTDISEDKYSYKWQVERDNICPYCGQPVTAEDMTRQVDVKRPWGTPHGHCREMWQRYNWQPVLFSSGGEEQEPMNEVNAKPGS
jgi:hypothetical protein